MKIPKGKFWCVGNCCWPGRSCGHVGPFYSIQVMASRLPKRLTWHWVTFSVKFLDLYGRKPTWPLHAGQVGPSGQVSPFIFNVDTTKLTWHEGLTWPVTVAK